MAEEQKEKNKKSIKWIIFLSILISGILFSGIYYLVWLAFQSDGTGALKEPQDFKTQVETKYTWQLEDMFSSLETAKASEKTLEKALNDFKAYRGHLSERVTYEKAISAYADLQIGIEKLSIYSNLLRDSDTSNQDADDFATNVTHLQEKIGEETAFLKQELSKLSVEKLRYYQKLEATKSSPYVIHDVIYDKENINSPEVEKLLNAYYSLENNVSEPYKSFWNRYHPPTSEGYKEADYYSKDDKKRFEATRISMEKAIDASEVLASLLEGKVAYDNGLVKIYGYESDLAMVLSQDGLSQTAYQELKDQTNAHLSVLHRWIAYKKRALALERPYEYHDEQIKWYEPSEVSFDQAHQMVLEATKPLGKKYATILNSAFDKRWIDVYPRQTKEKGNYTWGAYASHPYVLLNYNDDFNSASTLAHELGHAVHNELTREVQGYETSTNGILKAEIASTTNEVLFLESAIKSKDEALSHEAKIAYIELIAGTMFEQMKASEFETAIHNAQMKGENLDSAFLNKTWRDLSEKYYGKSYQVTDLDNYGWTGLDHLYWNQYMYKYATGLSSGFSIAQGLLSESKQTQEAYMAFLTSGSSKDPIEELARLNIHLDEKEVYAKCYMKMSELLSSLEEEEKK